MPMDSSEVSMLRMPTGSGGPGATTVDLSNSDERPRKGVWRELSGALSMGLAALAVVVVAFQVLAWARDMPGPGLTMVAGHLVAAVLAVLAQRFADRLDGWQSVVSVLAVIAVTGAALWLFWWA